jgi:hypothetical protein
MAGSCERGRLWKTEISDIIKSISKRFLKELYKRALKKGDLRSDSKAVP